MMQALVLACAAFAAQDSATGPSAKLIAPEGFAVDLIDSTPSLRWPSAVHCRADGSLLVAEDPMDMPGPTDQPLDRIWLYRWNADGSFTRTLFAEKLYACFGLEEIDGAVYVMNMPYLTVLRDVDGDGIAEQRKELLSDLGPPAPGHPGGFNDHIVSGLRYGMDGYLYVAVGDKGVPEAHGRDGSTISLRGGGIVRLRPDGTDLQIVARGLRNILDVAMDAQGEMFTYDNTDDGLGWWTRLTHVVPGGYYGYPWDYHDQPQRFLAPMAEYGGGSPTGGLVKREGGWPEPYEGSLFFCEWGDATLRRFQLEPDGGTFKVAAMEEFLQAGEVSNFRPTDVCESPDGRFLYVSDWGFGGWVSKEETGRLWRVRLSKDDAREPGGVLAGVANGADLAQALAAPGWRTRRLAQDEIVRTRDIAALERALEAGGPSALHGLHAARELALRVQRSASLELPRISLAVSPLLTSEDAQLRRAALLTLATTLTVSNIEGGQGAIAQLALAELEAQDLFVRQDALGVLIAAADASWAEDPRARTAAWRVAVQSHVARSRWRALASGRIEPERFALFFLDGESQALELLDAIEDSALRTAQTRRAALEDGPPRGPFEDLEACGLRDLALGRGPSRELAVRAAALHTLAVLARVCEPWDGKWWSIDPARHGHPKRTLDWSGTPIANATISAALDDVDVEIRRAAIAAVVETGDARLAPALRSRMANETDQAARSALLEALGKLGGPEDGALFARIVRESTQADERLLALRLGAACAPQAMLAVAFELASNPATPAEVCSACLELLATDTKADAAMRHARFEIGARSCAHASTNVRKSACKLIAVADPKQALPLLLPLLRDPAVRPAAFEALCELGDPRAARAYAQGLGDEDPTLRSAARRAISRSKDELRPALEGLVRRQELDGAAVRELRTLYSGQQPILEWEIVGPIAAEAPEAALDFAASNAAASRAKLAGLKSQRAVSTRADGMIDLDELLTDKSQQAAFAFATLVNERERDVELHAGSDDQLRVWLNGALVHEYDGARAFTAEADRFPARLIAGENSIVLRIGQIGGDWSFALTAPEPGEGPIFEAKLPTRPSPAEYAAFAAEHAGDAARGEAVALDKNRSLCLRCHVVGGVGEQVGPDLSGIGARYTRQELIASILTPSARIAEGYSAVSVLTTDDQLHFGQLRRDDPKGVTLVDPTGTALEIPREEIAELRPSKQSVMPEGLCHTMTPQEFADLVAWLSRR